jgi:hypothetical protein
VLSALTIRLSRVGRPGLTRHVAPVTPPQQLAGVR